MGSMAVVAPALASVVGTSTSWIGVFGESAQYEGVRGASHNRDHGGGVGINDAGGAGIYGRSTNGGFAIVADSKLSITGGSDVAERFASVDDQPIAPGSVVVVDETHPGQLKLSNSAYDRKVVGIISGAGGVEPGLILHQAGVLEGDLVVAITGRVYCKAEAESAPVMPTPTPRPDATPTPSVIIPTVTPTGTPGENNSASVKLFLPLVER